MDPVGPGAGGGTVNLDTGALGVSADGGDPFAYAGRLAAVDEALGRVDVGRRHCPLCVCPSAGLGPASCSSPMPSCGVQCRPESCGGPSTRMAGRARPCGRSWSAAPAGSRAATSRRRTRSWAEAPRASGAASRSARPRPRGCRGNGATYPVAPLSRQRARLRLTVAGRCLGPHSGSPDNTQAAQSFVVAPLARISIFASQSARALG